MTTHKSTNGGAPAALASPRGIRVRILEILGRQASTAADLAVELGITKVQATNNLQDMKRLGKVVHAGVKPRSGRNGRPFKYWTVPNFSETTVS